MHFLCTHHRRQLLATSDNQHLIDTWFEWMSTGGLYYELEQWNESIPYVGCAFDLISDALWARRIEPRLGATKVTLSAIYLAETFRQCHAEDKARFSLGAAFQRLGIVLGTDAAPWARECMGTLLDTDRHPAFFQRFLNLPFSARPEQRMTH